MKIALVSLDQSWEDKEQNRVKVEGSLEKLKKEEMIDFVIFPEMTLTGFTMNSKKIAEDRETSTTINFFKNIAIDHSVYIGFGVVLKKDDKATNNFFIVSPNGEIKASYTKIHPFSFSGEHHVYESGDQLSFCNIKDAIIGLTICYDLRFPELYQALSKKCDVIINIANWPKSRINHWNILLKARAIENQSFIAGVNRIGKDGNNIDYELSSQVVSPLGNVLTSNKVSEKIDIFDIKTEEVYDCRKSFSLKKDRKISLYRKFYEATTNTR